MKINEDGTFEDIPSPDGTIDNDAIVEDVSSANNQPPKKLRLEEDEDVGLSPSKKLRSKYKDEESLLTPLHIDVDHCFGSASNSWSCTKRKIKMDCTKIKKKKEDEGRSEDDYFRKR